MVIYNIISMQFAIGPKSEHFFHCSDIFSDILILATSRCTDRYCQMSIDRLVKISCCDSEAQHIFLLFSMTCMVTCKAISAASMVPLKITIGSSGM